MTVYFILGNVMDPKRRLRSIDTEPERSKFSKHEWIVDPVTYARYRIGRDAFISRAVATATIRNKLAKLAAQYRERAAKVDKLIEQMRCD